MANQSKNIFFWIFIDDLNIYEQKIVISFRQKGKFKHKLNTSGIHKDILMISFNTNDVIHDRCKLQYRYKIDKYKTEEINREYTLTEQINDIYIFDTPLKFVQKQFFGLKNYILLEQKYAEKSLLQFLKPKTTMMIINKLKKFIEERKFYQLFQQFTQEALNTFNLKLKTTEVYEEDIEQYFDFLDSLNKYGDMKLVKKQNIVKIARNLSRYYHIYLASNQNIDENKSKRLRNKLINLYAQDTQLEERIKILLDEHCAWTSKEAEDHLNKKEYNSIILSYPYYYIKLFSKETLNYKDLFILQIKRVITLLLENKKDGMVRLISTQKEILKMLPESQLRQIESEVFKIKDFLYVNQKNKAYEILNNIKDIAEVFKIQKYEEKEYVILTLHHLNQEFLEFKILEYFISKCNQYKIDLFQFEFLYYQFQQQFFYDQSKMDYFIQQQINYNPFINLRFILFNFFEKFQGQILSHKLVDLIQLKAKYVYQLKKLQEKQKQILQKRETKRKQNLDIQNIQAKENSDLAKPLEIPSMINKSDNQWDKDILSDDQIRQQVFFNILKQKNKNFFNQKQKIDVQQNEQINHQKDQSIEIKEKLLKEKYQKNQAEIAITDIQMKEFEQKLIEVIEKKIMSMTTLSLAHIDNLSQLNEEDRNFFEFTVNNLQYIRMKRENSTEEDFFKNYQETKKVQFSQYNINLVFQIFDQLAVERVKPLLDEINNFELFNSYFAYRFLGICDLQSEFYQKMQKHAQYVSQSLSQNNYNIQSIKLLLKQKYFYEIMKQLNIQIQFQNIEKQIQEIESKEKRFKIFFNKFCEYFPNQHQNLQKVQINQIQLKDIPKFFNQLGQYDILSQNFIRIYESKVVQNILLQLKNHFNQQMEKMEKDIKLFQLKNQANPSENVEAQIFQIRLTNFSQLILNLIENIQIFGLVIFDCGEGNIKRLDEFRKVATLVLQNYIKEENQQQKIMQIQMQPNIEDQQNQQPQNQQQQNNYYLFDVQVSLNSLKPYLGENLDQIIENIKQFHSILKVNKNINEIEQSMKKCYTSTIYLDCFDIIQKVGDTLQLDWNQYENTQMKYLQNLLSNFQDLKNQPAKEVMKIQIPEQIIRDYQVIGQEKNIQRNMGMLIQSQEIIKHSEQNKQKNISYLDMRDFIGDNDYDLSSFLTVLNEFAQFFLKLSETQQDIITHKKSILQAIIQLNQLIQNQIKTDSKVLQWEEIINNFHKIASIENNIDKKKSYLNLLKKMYSHGSTTIQIDIGNSSVSFLIECDEKSYSEQEINEISSRVLIEKNSIKAVFGQEKQQQISQSQQRLIMNIPKQDQEKLQMQAQEQKMEKFKKQLELTQDLKQIIQEMISYGYFLFEEKQYVYNNQNNNYPKNMTLMENKLKQFKGLLQNWKNKIDCIVKQYPKFSFISYSSYLAINQFLQKEIDECDLSNYLKQIIKYQVQTTPFEGRSVYQTFQNYKNCKPQNKLQFIAQFITQNQEVIDQGGMMKINEKRIKLIQYSSTQEALYQLFVLNQNQLNMKSQYYIFCEKSTTVQDVQLFIQRYKYLNEDQPKNFFMIIYSSSFNSYLDELVHLQNDQPFLNQLYILVKRDLYNERLCSIKQDYSYQIQDRSIENLKKQEHIKKIQQNAYFFTSVEPGVGKTQAIQVKCQQQYNKKTIRIPTNGDGNKQSFIKYLMKNIKNNEDQKRIYHIDLYENDNIDLNFILFEMIVLKSINFNQKSYLHLGDQSIFFIEINNTLRNCLGNSLQIKDYFQVSQISFNINNLCLNSFKIANKYETAVYAYKYLRFLKQYFTTNTFCFDDQNCVQELNNLKEIERNEFQQLLDEYLVQYLITNQINPNFWQINNFINLFGNEMQKMESSPYLIFSVVERSQLRQGLRTIIVNKSFELCRKVSLSCLKNTFVDNDQISNAQLLTNKAESLIPFSSFLQDFVTFQEQKQPCITSFFQNSQTTPKPIKDLYSQHQHKLLHFDEEQSPDRLVNWLISLCNEHIQRFYVNQNEISLEKILNAELRNELERIIIQKDNFFKIAMIFMRMRSLIPSIIMVKYFFKIQLFIKIFSHQQGEAGIGKTALIRLLSLIAEANFSTKIIHAGVTEAEVIEFIENAESQLKENPNKKTVLFFDEVNTNKLVGGLFKEIIVDKHLKGRKLPDNIIPVAALNPYKLKSEEQQKIIQIQIHGGIKQDLVNKIKGSDLEYTVNPIPDSMYSFSWNYGGLNERDEKTYITQILLQMNKHLYQSKQENFKTDIIKNQVSELVFKSQQYMRKLMGRVSACSLRDVKRFVTILVNNINFLIVSSNLSHQNKLNIQDKSIQPLALYLSFYINYCVRIPLQEKREEYLQILQNIYKELNYSQMKASCECVEKFLINQIDVPIGRMYLSFLFALSIRYQFVQQAQILKINQGPPGSSKTLSLRLLIQSMQGVNSRSELFKKYPALMPQYYQGHIQSTSERIMEVFEQASKKQQGFNSKEVGHQNLSLVYIDEIGLAEISPHNPLKVLHATLEKPDIAVSCISNWPLDASKMNRMLTVYRMDINSQQLIETFQSIFEEIKDQQKDEFKKEMLNRSQLNNYEIQKQIANIYLDYLQNLKNQEKKFEQFHGPRDFFSACKQICSEEISFIESEQRSDMNSGSVKSLNDRIIKAFYRHFSGLEKSQQLLQDVFSHLKMEHSYEFRPSELIEHNLNEEPKFFTSRHLMVISDDVQNAIVFLKSKLHSREHQFFIGSDFEQDKQMQACYNVINKIVSCIEKGMVVTLLNLDNIYQSLYEVLNQSYRYYNGKYFCKISFGAESSNIEVSQNFKLILLVNQNQIHRMDGPLLNRFEKHLLKDNVILSSQDMKNIQLVNESLKGFQKSVDFNKNLFQKQYQIVQDKHPLFKFTNVESIIQNFYLQYKLQKQQAIGSNEDCQLTREDQSNIFKRIFHLTDFFSVFIRGDQHNISNFLNSYIQSQYHFSLSGFIENRIMNQQNKENNDDHLISEWAYFYNQNKAKECQVRLFNVISPQAFISDKRTSQLENIFLSQIASEQELTKRITNFLNEGLPQFPQQQVKRFYTIGYKKNQTDDLAEKPYSFLKQDHHSNRVDQRILLVIGDMSKSGQDSYDRIVFTMQKISECADQFLANVKAQFPDNYENDSLQLNVIFIVKVEEVYKMVPIEGRWEHYYIEDLTPFHLFNNQQQDMHDMELNNEIKENLCLENIFKNKTILISNVIKYQVLTEYYIQSDLQIFANAFREIKYSPNEEINEFEYKSERLNKIVLIFKEYYREDLVPIISNMIFKIMKYEYSIETFNDLVLNYLIPNGFSVQFSSFHLCVLTAFQQMIEKKLNKLTYGMVQCKVPEYINYVKEEIKSIPDKYKSLRQESFKSLSMNRNIVISESENIFRVLLSYQVSINHLKQGLITQQDELFLNMYNAVRENLQGYKTQVRLFSQQILDDIKNSIPNQINFLDVQIARIILLISKDEDSFIQNEDYLFEKVHIKPIQSSEDIIIPIFLAIFILQEDIMDLRELLLGYRFSIEQLSDEFVKLGRSRNLKLSESIKLLKEVIIFNMFEKLKPTSNFVQVNQYLNKNYPTLTKQFLEYVDKNNTSDEYQSIKHEITLVNLICEEFTELLSKKNLLANMKFDKIMSIDYKELTEMRECFQSFYHDVMMSSQVGQQQINIDIIFTTKWNNFLKTLIRTSTEYNYYKEFSPRLIKLLLQLELDEIQQYQIISKSFKIFLNLVFKQIGKSLTYENIQKSFNLDFQDLFSDSNGQPYHTEYYTFQQFSETMQNCVYSYLLNEKANENVEYLYILIEHDYESLHTLQKLIYLSVFREFIYQIVNMYSIDNSLITEKINQCSQNSKEVEGLYEQNYTVLDQSLQKFLQNLNYQPMKIYIVKNIIFSNKNVDDFIKKSFYLKGCFWLNSFFQYKFNYHQLYVLNHKNLDYQQNKNQYFQQELERIIFGQIQNCNNVFKEMFNGIIQHERYYPFSLKNYVQSQIDFYNIYQGDNLKSLYQCYKCKNYLVVDQQLNNSMIAFCSFCQIQISLANQSEAFLILQNLDNKHQLRQSILQEKGFCLMLDSKTSLNSFNQNAPEIQALMNLLYYISLKLSLRYKENNPLNQLSTKQQFIYNTQNNSVTAQNIDILEINKILNIPIQQDYYKYIEEQINLSMMTFYQILWNKKQFNQSKSMYLMKYLIEYLLGMNIQATQYPDQTQINMTISNQVLSKMQEFDLLYTDLFSLIIEDYQTINDFQNYNHYLSINPKTLRVITKNSNENIIESMKKYNLEYLQNNFPHLLQYLNFNYFNFLNRSLKIFITFYQQTMIYFSNQFEVKDSKEMNLKDALNKLKLDVSEQFYNQYLNTFIPCWNEVINFFQFIKINIFSFKKQVFQQRYGFQYQSGNVDQLISRIDANTKLFDLIFSNKYQTMFTILIKYLSDIQNQIIKNMLFYCQQNPQIPHVQKIYQQIWIQFLDSQGNLQAQGLQDIKADLNIIKVPQKELIEKFACLDLDEGDYIYDRRIYEFENLETDIVLTVFKFVKCISLEKSIQFSFLLSFNELSTFSNEMIIPQENLQQNLIDYLKSNLTNQDFVNDAYYKMLTVLSFFKQSPIQQKETTLKTAMKQLNINFSFQKINQVLEEQILLKHLKGFIDLLEELNMNKFVQFCKDKYRIEEPNEKFNSLFQYVFSDINLLKNFKLMIGRFIIRFLSGELDLNPQRQLTDIFDNNSFNLGCINQTLDNNQLKILLSGFQFQNCYQIYELITKYQSQEYKKQDQNQADGLFLENFTDENHRKSIRELTIRQK